MSDQSQFSKENGCDEIIVKSLPMSAYIIHGIFFTIYGLVKYIPSPIGDPLRYAVLKLFVKRMGYVRIYEGVTVWYPYNITFGSNISLNEWVYLSGAGNITIHDRVRIGHRVSIITSDHIFKDVTSPIKDQGLVFSPVVIHSDAWIGCNATILKGVTIGEGAIVSAGAVVSKDVPAYSVVAGVPARVISMRYGK